MSPVLFAGPRYRTIRTSVLLHPQVVSHCSPTNFRDGANGESASDQFSRDIESATVIPHWLSSHRLDSCTVALSLRFATYQDPRPTVWERPRLCSKVGGARSDSDEPHRNRPGLSTGAKQGRLPETCFYPCRSWLRLNRRSKFLCLSSLRSRRSAHRLISSLAFPSLGWRQPPE